MLRKLSGTSPPLTPSRTSSKELKAKTQNTKELKPKSQNLLRCSTSLLDVQATTMAPPVVRQPQQDAKPLINPHDEQYHAQAQLLPPEALISILDGFAKLLVSDHGRLELLKSKCLQGAKLGQEDGCTPLSAGSILKSSHTMLTYLSWGIRHIEKASTWLHEADMSSVEEHLNKAEQMLRSLTDSLEQEFDHDQSAGPSARIPNAGFIQSLAHVFLALVWKIRRNATRSVVFHLLEAFVICPRHARQSLAPELWGQLFRPLLSPVEVWYKKEHINIVSQFSRSSSVSAANSKQCSPFSSNNPSPMPANAVVARANSLMDLVAGLRLSKRPANTNTMQTSSNNRKQSDDESKCIEKISMQVNLLYDLYEQSLDEGTLQYARQYQDRIKNYYGRVTSYKSSETQIAGVNQMAESGVNELAAAGCAHHVADSLGEPNVHATSFFKGGLMGASALQLRRSLYDAVFGVVHPLGRTTKKSNPSSQVASFLHVCSKDLPQVLDLRRANSISQDAPTGPRPLGPGLPVTNIATMRDIVNTAPSPIAQTFLASSMDVPTYTSSPNLSDNRSQESTSAYGTPSTQSSYYGQNKPDDSPKAAAVIVPNSACNEGLSRRLIDLLQDTNNHQSEKKSSPSVKNTERNNQPCTNELMQQHRTSIHALNMKGTKTDEQRIMKRSNSESSSVPVAKNSVRRVLPTTGGKEKRRFDLKVSPSKEREREVCKLLVVDKEMADEVPDVQIKHCTSFQVQTAQGSTQGQLECGSFTNFLKLDRQQARAPTSAPLAKAHQDCIDGQIMLTRVQEVANELREAVSAAKSHGRSADVGRCEEVLLRLSQSWLECKSAPIMQTRQACNEEEANSTTGSCVLDGLTEELLFVLGASELQEAQRLALCLLSASLGKLSKPSALPQGQDQQQGVNGSNSTATGHLSNPPVLHVLSHLLQQQGRLPEAALLLHLLHPAQYSASCHQFLPHLLPLLLDLAQHSDQAPMQTKFNRTTAQGHDHLHLPGDFVKPRALAFMMMSRLLAVVDHANRLQACKHALFPNVNALPCLLHSLDHASSLDERVAAAFILTTCMQADELYRCQIVSKVKLPSVVALMQQSASNTSTFRTVVEFVTELLCSRKLNVPEMLGCIRQDGLLNCMHALMAYLQTAPLENQPPAAGLLFQLDLLLGDEHRYSVFREEALETLLAPLLSENSKEASFNAARVLSTIGRNHSEQELEAWLLRKAGLGCAETARASNRHDQHKRSSSASCVGPLRQELGNNVNKECEDETALVADWDEKVARAMIQQGRGELVSRALAKGLQSSTVEVRKACLLVATWLTSHLIIMPHISRGKNYEPKQTHLRPCRDSKSTEALKSAAKKHMKEALHADLEKVAAVGSGHAIVERVCAALALQNLAR